MNKKGFTLIELLAVILILGIIALIAIPVVTKMIDQANISSFKETNQNIASAAENACSTAQLNGTAMTAGYSFSSDGASSKIDVKGKLPTGGAVSTTNSCKSVVYTTNNKYCAVKTADEDEVSVGKLVDGKCSIIMNDDSYCTKDTTPGVMGGTGTEADPYTIDSIEDLMGLVQAVHNDDNHFAGKYVKLNTNIDFKNSCSYANSNNTTFGDINGDGNVDGLMTELTTGAGFLPIGYGYEYSGNFDGGNHYISNLYVSRTSGSSAFINELYLSSGTSTIKDINFINANIVGSYNNAVLVGYISVYNAEGENPQVTINNINISGNVSGSSHTALAIGDVSVSNDDSLHVSNVSTLGNVTGTSSYTAGFCGHVDGNGTYEKIYNYANVTGPYPTGGLFGKNDDSIIRDVVNYGNVTDNGSEYSNAFGGIIGYSNGVDSLTNVYNYGTITGSRYVGGMIGYGGCTICNNLFNYGTIKYNQYGQSISSNAENYGGLFGSFWSSSPVINNLYNYGDVYGANYTGGIIGYGSSAAINNAANYGNIYGQYSIGGIIGNGSSALNNVLNTGTINIKSYATNGNDGVGGGIIGYGGSTINNAYSTGNINVENNYTSYSHIGGIVGQGSPTINNSYVKGNITVKNNVAVSTEYIGGIVGSGTPTITNSFYKGSLTSDLDSAVIGTIAGDSGSTISNAYYSIGNTANIDNLEGVSISSVNSPWFNNTALLGNAFDYTNGIYPRLYQYGTNTFMLDQEKVSY